VGIREGERKDGRRGNGKGQGAREAKDKKEGGEMQGEREGRKRNRRGGKRKGTIKEEAGDNKEGGEAVQTVFFR